MSKSKLQILILCCCMIPFSLKPLLAMIEQGTRSHPNFEGISLQGMERRSSVDGTEMLALRPADRSHNRNNLLYLDFEVDVPAMLSDLSQNYRISTTDFHIVNESRLGQRSAHFQRAGHRLAIDAPTGIWPDGDPLADFTIEMWIKPHHLQTNNEILRRSTGYDGRMQGLEISIESDRIAAHFRNMFRDTSNRTHSISLHSIDKIEIGKWIHVAVSFHSGSGRTALYINGKENHVIMAENSAGLYLAAFHELDRSPIIVGNGFTGLIDELRILRTAYTDNESDVSLYPGLNHRNQALISTEVPAAYAVSQVMESGRHTIGGQIHFHADVPAGTGIEYYYRTSEHPFRANTSENDLPFRPASQITELDSFRYIQWKVQMRSDPQGRLSPKLHHVEIQYNTRSLPSRPQQLAIIGELSDSNRITLEWTENPEPEVRRSGYIIYYGLSPDQYQGRIAFNIDNGTATPIRRGNIELTESERDIQRRRPEEMERRMAHRVRFSLNNEIIFENIRRQSRREHMPVIRAGRTYYFSIAAIDDAGNESELSNQVEIYIPEN